jgi:hypothetical protein
MNDKNGAKKQRVKIQVKIFTALGDFKNIKKPIDIIAMKNVSMRSHRHD